MPTNTTNINKQNRLYPERLGGVLLLSTCILRENSSFSRNGPVAASPCKDMGQCHLTNPAQGEFASKKCLNMF